MIIHDHEQGTPEWFSARLGKPTGSKAACLINYEGKPSKPETLKNYADKLADDLFCGEDTDDWSGNRHTEHGHEYEDHARTWYAKELDTDVREVGFVTDDLMRYGASPDGLIEIGGKIIGGAEFKCFPKRHSAALRYYRRHNRPMAAIVPQLHFEILACELEWNDIVHYHPRLPKLIIRVERDDKYLATLREQIALCIERRDESLEILKSYGEVA